jgi:hypothetical protein
VRAVRQRQRHVDRVASHRVGPGPSARRVNPAVMRARQVRSRFLEA